MLKENSVSIHVRHRRLDEEKKPRDLINRR